MAVAVDRDDVMEKRRVFRSECQRLVGTTQHLDDEGVEIPDLAILLRMPLGDAVHTLRCTDAQKKAAKAIIHVIVRDCLHPAMRPIDIYEAGSFKRGTALKFKFDVDLVMKLSNFDHRRMEHYMKQCKQALLDHYGDQIYFFEHSHRCLQFRVSGSLEVDLLITGDPEQNAFNNPVSYYEPAGSHEVDDKLKLAKHEFPTFQALVLLCKHWKYLHTGKYFLKSFYVELFCYRLVQEHQKNQRPLPLKEAFRIFLLDFISGRLAVPNLNRYSIANLQPYSAAIPELQTYARETMQEHFGLEACKSGYRIRTAMRLDGESACECVYQLRTNSADNNNQDEKARVGETPEWEGACRYVAKGQYTGKRWGQPCVAKWFKAGVVFEDTFWSQDLKAVEKAAEILEAWNLYAPSDYLVRINRPGVWEKQTDQQKVLVEPFLPNFQKFNSNTGYMRRSTRGSDVTDLMHALSHFSYHYTSGKYLLCDLQGSRNGNQCTLTDPVIFSTDRKFGLTDLGIDGIQNFFYYHTCNRFCRRHWIEAMPKQIYVAEEGTAFAHQARRRDESNVEVVRRRDEGDAFAPQVVVALPWLFAFLLLFFFLGLAMDRDRRY